MQIDVTATPKHQNGAIFAQTICDYPLVEAIAQNVVKTPVLPDPASRSKLDEIASDINVEDFSQKAAEIGLLALDGKDGPAKDTLIFTASIALSIIKKIQFTDAADQIKKAINSGKAKEFFYNAR